MVYVIITFLLFAIGLIVYAFKTREPYQQNDDEPSTYYIKKPADTLSNYTYEELLKTPKWKEKRLQILKRDGFKCQLCGYNKALNVHHKYYNIYPDGKKVAPWEYPDDCFITLCKKCHENAHEKRQVKTYYRSYWS